VSVAFDRSRPPAPTPTRAFSPPGFDRTRLPNGLELIVAPRKSAPLVVGELLLPAGGDCEPDGPPGLAALTTALLDEGSARRSGIELASALERLGSALVTYVDWDAARVYVSGLARHLGAALEALAEVAFEPSFPQRELDRLRAQTLAELSRISDRPSRLAERELARALYPGDAFGELLQGNPESVTALTREEIVDFHARHAREGGAKLVLAGSISPDEIRSRVDALFGPQSSTEPPRATDASSTRDANPAASAARRIRIVDLPNAPQTELRVGHGGVPRTHPDRTRLGVLNSLLGGKFTSRLNLQLRERRGFTYGVSSRFVDRRRAGPFVVGASVANDVVGTAVADTLVELERLRQEAVPRAELDETRSYLLGVQPYTYQTLDGWLARLSDLALYGLPDDHLERALSEVRTTTAEDLLRLAREHLRPETATIVAVGPAGVLTPQLKPLGEVSIFPVDRPTAGSAG